MDINIVAEKKETRKKMSPQTPCLQYFSLKESMTNAKPIQDANTIASIVFPWSKGMISATMKTNALFANGLNE
jgi:hypothetical protein